MSKRKKNQEVTPEITEVQTVNVEPVEVEQPEEPKDQKQIIMEDFIEFYNSNVKGKSVVSGEIGRQIVNYFNAYSDSRVVYTGCGSCVSSKISYMKKQAKEKYNIIF